MWDGEVCAPEEDEREESVEHNRDKEDALFVCGGEVVGMDYVHSARVEGRKEGGEG